MATKISPAGSSTTNDAGTHKPRGGSPDKSKNKSGTVAHFIAFANQRSSTSGTGIEGPVSRPVSKSFDSDVVFRRQKREYYDDFFSHCGSCRKFFKSRTPYLIISWTIFLLISLLAVLDRFFWNVTPRQEFALKLDWSMCQKQKSIILNTTTNETVFKIASGCGNDYFCGDKAQQDLLNAKDGPLGCLKKGPWTVQLFDVLSRISGRLIITATSLLFLTVCRCSWNFLASSNIPWLRRYLNNWQQDNMTLHKWGGWILGVCTVIHVWSFLLPSVFNGFTNRFVTKETFSWPLQITTGMSSLMIDEKYANWSFDDIWRLFWMTVMLCVLIPLTRAAKALAFNYSAMMWLHVFVGVIYFIDSFRRRSHPHVWLYNTPFFIWYILDRIVGLTCYRFERGSKVRVFRLDDDYQVLMWQHENIKKVLQTSSGDIYWMKSSKRTKEQTASFCDKNCRRTFEWAHPFTTASIMYTADFLSVENPNLRDRYEEHRFPTIEQPSHVHDPGWEGHRFRMDPLIDFHIQKQSALKRKQSSTVRASGSERSNTAQLQAELNNLDITFSVASHGHLPASRHSLPRSDTLHIVEAGAVRMPATIGTDSANEETETPRKVEGPAARSAVSKSNARTSQHQKGDGTTAEKDIDKEQKNSGDEQKNTHNERTNIGDDEGKTNEISRPHASSAFRMKRFKSVSFRKAHSLAVSAHVPVEEYDKCIVTKIYRKQIRKKSCLRSFFGRVPETQSWEPTGASGITEMDVSGPYQSEYARLKHYLDPEDLTAIGPLVVIATGAGAAIALDTMSMIRGWNQGYGLRLHYPVSIYYSTYSLALMQFVSNALLMDPVKGVHVQVALTRQEVVALKGENSPKKRAGEVQFSRIDLVRAVESIEDERTAIFFCGGGAMNKMLKGACVKKGLAYYGSAVE